MAVIFALESKNQNLPSPIVSVGVVDGNTPSAELMDMLREARTRVLIRENRYERRPKYVAGTFEETLYMRQLASGEDIASALMSPASLSDFSPIAIPN